MDIIFTNNYIRKKKLGSIGGLLKANTQEQQLEEKKFIKLNIFTLERTDCAWPCDKKCITAIPTSYRVNLAPMHG